MAKKNRKGRSGGRWADQAALQSLVRFGPEESGLAELEQQLGGNFASTVQSAQANAAGVVDAVNQTLPEVRRLYNQAGLQQTRTNDTLIHGDLAGLSSVADSIKGGAALEAATQLGNLREAKTSALRDLTTRRVGAKEGQQWAIQNAQRQLEQGLTQLYERKQALASERGAFEALTIQDLRQAAQDRAQEIRIEQMGNRSSRTNALIGAGQMPDGSLTPAERRQRRQNRRDARADRRDARADRRDEREKERKDRWRDTDEHAEFQDSVGSALSQAKAMASAGRPRGSAAKTLVQGRPVTTVEADDGTELKLPAIDSTSPLIASIALDLAYDGHISERNRQRLIDRKYRPKWFGWSLRPQSKSQTQLPSVGGTANVGTK